MAQVGNQLPFKFTNWKKTLGTRRNMKESDWEEIKEEQLAKYYTTPTPPDIVLPEEREDPKPRPPKPPKSEVPKAPEGNGKFTPKFDA